MSLAMGLAGRGGARNLSGGAVADVLRRSVAYYDLWLSPDCTFQEAAASTPADAPGDPIGALLDVFRRDVAATQATSGYRPTLGRTVKGGRTNFALDSDNFSTWSNTGSISITDDASRTPDGNVAWLINGGGAGTKQLWRVYPIAISPPFTVSFIVKQSSAATEANRYNIRNNTTGTDVTFFAVNFSTLAVSYSACSQPSGVTVTALSDGYLLVKKTFTTGFSLNDNIVIYAAFVGGSEGANEASYFGEFKINQGTEVLPHQVIGGSSLLDITEVGKESLWYVSFDQVDDALAVTVPDLGSDAVVGYADETGVTILEGQTIDSSYPLITSLRLSALILFDDLLTGLEKNAVRDILKRSTEVVY